MNIRKEGLVQASNKCTKKRQSKPNLSKWNDMNQESEKDVSIVHLY